MDVVKKFAANVKSLRLKRGLSQEELAEKAGLHRTYIGSVERGERNVTLESAERIAAALNSTLQDCLAETEVKS